MLRMLKCGYFLLLVMLCVGSSLWSQTSQKYSGEYANFYRGEELFEKEQYSAARKVFTEVLEELDNSNDPFYIKARYYQGLSALELYNNDAVNLLLSFNNDYPESIYKQTIFFKIGLHFYQTKKYKDALEWLERVNPIQLDTAYRAEYTFKLGYSYFQLEDYSPARNAFYDIKEGKTPYAAPAMYYFAHIAYENKNYQVALEAFKTLVNNTTFNKEVPYYITQIYYLQKKYQQVIDYAPVYLDSVAKQSTPEMNRIIGDAYYKLSRYDEAVTYLEAYSKGSKTTREDDYKLGYAYLMSTYYDRAIRQFDRVARGKDALAQVAFYHAAEAYLKKEEPNNARSAFEAASQMDYDIKIQEDALFNYAVLSYELDYNPYNDAIRAFELFLNQFPNSKRKEDVYEYLVNVYTTTKNYQAALASIERINNKNVRLKKAYQTVAYNMGVELYERGKFSEAIKALDKVTIYPVDQKLIGQAKFWQADANYMLRDYNPAIKKYREFLAVSGISDPALKTLAYYNIAYAYYDQNDFVQAIESFRTFTQLPSNKDKVRLADAYMRIGDAYFTKVNPEFEKAALNYEKALALKQPNRDRTLFYLGKVYGFIYDKRQAKITTLLDIVNNHKTSSYVVPSIFEIGLSYKYEGDFDKGYTFLNQIITDYPNSILVKDALIEMGDIRYKQKKYDEAESYFNRVLNEYDLDDATCLKATTGLTDVFRATRQQERIAEVAQKYACAAITEDKQEEFFYETANELYLNEKYDEAIPEITKYLSAYPEGRFSTQLISFLADIYYQRNEKGQALALYERIIKRPTSSYTEEVLVRASKTLYNEGEYEQALPHYLRLEGLTQTPQVVYNTRVGLMRCYYLLEVYNAAATAAQKVLSDDLINEAIRLEANYIAGLSLFNVKNYNESLTYLKWTADNTGEVRGTEAHHTLAEAHFQLNNFDEVEQLHKDLLQRKPAYDYWIARSLLLQARVFMRKDDLFQAENTVNLVMRNYPDKEDGILMEAEKFLAELMQLKDEPEKSEEEIERVINIEEGGDDE